MRRLVIAACAAIAACGDNTLGVGLELAPAHALFITAHLDDDMIFMQPELVDAIARGGSTTVYVTSGDPQGHQHARGVFEAAMTAYEHQAGSIDWQCGQLEVNGLPVHHCRLIDREISLIGLDVAEGGRRNERRDSLTHLIEQEVTSLPLLGPAGGRVTIPTLIDELTAIIDATDPSELHILDYAGTHGDDHPGHMAAASFALWAAARSKYRGAITSHRGYSVEPEPENLVGDELAAVAPMLNYFEACYFGCAVCGTPCAKIEEHHDIWVRRQYASTTGYAAGRLEAVDSPGRCVAVIDQVVGLAGCDDDRVARLDGDGWLVAGDRCIASGAANDDPLVVTPCDGRPATRWLVDSEGGVWGAEPPVPVADMAFDHLRCLSSSPMGAPLCGSRRLVRWRVIP